MELGIKSLLFSLYLIQFKESISIMQVWQLIQIKLSLVCIISNLQFID